MKQDQDDKRPLRWGLLSVLMVGCLVIASSGVQAAAPGSEYDANVFGAPVSASDGSTISMVGSIHFKLRKGRTLPDDVSGGGTFTIETADGETSGDWMTTKLEGFHVEGRCGDHPDCLAALGDARADWTAGKGTFKIHLDGVGPARFIMWCRLPGIKLPQFSAFPESYRVDIGSWHFDGQEPAGNFFERTAE